MKASLEDYTRTIPAKGKVPYTIGGRVFLCFAVSAALQVRFDNGTPVPVFAGLKFKLPDNDAFKTISFENSGAAPVSVSLYAGTIDMELTKVN